MVPVNALFWSCLFCKLFIFLKKELDKRNGYFRIQEFQTC